MGWNPFKRKKKKPDRSRAEAAYWKSMSGINQKNYNQQNIHFNKHKHDSAVDKMNSTNTINGLKTKELETLNRHVEQIKDVKENTLAAVVEDILPDNSLYEPFANLMGSPSKSAVVKASTFVKSAQTGGAATTVKPELFIESYRLALDREIDISLKTLRHTLDKYLKYHDYNNSLIASSVRITKNNSQYDTDITDLQAVTNTNQRRTEYETQLVVSGNRWKNILTGVYFVAILMYAYYGGRHVFHNFTSAAATRFAVSIVVMVIFPILIEPAFQRLFQLLATVVERVRMKLHV